MGDRYLIFYKPYGVLSQFTDEDSNPDTQKSTLKDFINVPNVYAAGRLDYDSEGLLFLTSNGRLQHRLTDPKFRHPRTYLAQVENIPTATAIKALEQGVTIQGYTTQPAQIRLLDAEPTLPPRHPPIRYRATIPTAWLEMTLIEGKNRQVRRMTAAVGFPTLRLVRIAIAHLKLDTLQLGEWRDLTLPELKQLGKLTNLRL